MYEMCFSFFVSSFWIIFYVYSSLSVTSWDFMGCTESGVENKCYAANSTELMQMDKIQIIPCWTTYVSPVQLKI